MSFEGYVQRLCKNGHYSSGDVWTHRAGARCLERRCRASIVWTNLVDETNGAPQGKIDMEQFLVTPVKSETCPTCGHTQQSEPAIYRIPTPEETEKARQYFDED